MIVRATLSLFATAAILAASGCCNPHVYRGCGDACYPTPTPCGPCGPEVATCGPQAPCGDCGTCDPCPPACGCGACCGWHPGKHLVEWLTCGGGCGSVYVNEWVSDPPDCCDPCDPCGNYVGQQCCVPLHVKLWAYLKGQSCQEPYLPTLEFLPGCETSCCGQPDCCGDVGGMPVMTKGMPEHIQPAPRIVPGSPADQKGEMIPIPEPAPTGTANPKTAYRAKQPRAAYYPYGRIRPN